MSKKLRRIAATLGGAAPSSLLAGLVAYWKLGETSTGAAPVTRSDSVGALHMTDNNNTPSAAGKVGLACNFEADSNQSLSRASAAAVQIGDYDWTWAAWVNMESKAARMGIVSKFVDTSFEFLLEYHTDDIFKLAIYDVSQTEKSVASTFGSPQLATWYFIVAWHDAAADTINLQVNNGAADSSATAGIVPLAGPADFYIGGRAYPGSLLPWDGLISNVGRWNRKLTAAEITYSYNNGNGKTYPF